MPTSAQEAWCGINSRWLSSWVFELQAAVGSAEEQPTINHSALGSQEDGWLARSLVPEGHPPAAGVCQPEPTSVSHGRGPCGDPAGVEEIRKRGLLQGSIAQLQQERPPGLHALGCRGGRQQRKQQQQKKKPGRGGCRSLSGQKWLWTTWPPRVKLCGLGSLG